MKDNPKQPTEELEKILDLVRWGDYQEKDGTWQIGVANKSEIIKAINKSYLKKADVERAIGEARLAGEKAGRSDELVRISEWGKTIDAQWNKHFENRLKEIKGDV